MASTSWIVTTDGNRPVAAIAAELKQLGFAVRDVLDEVGCITGSATANAAAKARRVPGVSDVSPDPGFDVGPPDGGTTW